MAAVIKLNLRRRGGQRGGGVVGGESVVAGQGQQQLIAGQLLYDDFHRGGADVGRISDTTGLVGKTIGKVVVGKIDVHEFAVGGIQEIDAASAATPIISDGRGDGVAYGEGSIKGANRLGIGPIGSAVKHEGQIVGRIDVAGTGGRVGQIHHGADTDIKFPRTESSAQIGFIGE